MKKILLILALIAISATTFAQHTNSREAANGVTDASVTNYVTKTVHDTAGTTVDTMELRPNAKVSYYHVNVTDSSALRLRSLATSYLGDVIYLDINADNTETIYLVGAWVVSTGSAAITLDAGTGSMLKFWFDGEVWVEESRNLNY